MVFIKLNVNEDMIMNNVKRVALNTKVASENSQAKMIW